MASYMYSYTVSHAGLGKFRVVTGTSEYEVRMEAEELKAKWEEQYRKQQAREKHANDIEDLINEAERQNEEARENQQALESILASSIGQAEYSFDDMKSFQEFVQPMPSRQRHVSYPAEPNRTEERYNPKPGLFTKLSQKKMKEFNQQNDERFAADHNDWEQKRKAILDRNNRIDEWYQKALAKWTEDKEKFYNERASENQRIDDMEGKFKAGDSGAVEGFYDDMLASIEYPCDLDIQYATAYNSESKILIVDVLLPNLSDLPAIKSVTPVKKNLKLKYTYFSESTMKKVYDSVNYQIVLRTLKAIYTIDADYHLIDAVVVNGQLHTIDPSTGNEISPFILSLNIKMEDFGNLNLSNIDPRAWFKSVKGVSAPSLATVTPIQPLLQMNREDKRFIESYEVTSNIDSSTNLAAMDWQDFENLIREVFEAEFNENGGEVKITQASRDGGVDAVVFDPDPIRGGKIVLQAKRYTNVVGVSAVRDLYGTIMNEGAMKGILITTANYGPDAYAFAKDKPITLLTGANLLSLLEKHGHRARIDIQEAKGLLNKS